jgi:hypothetical protein
VSNPSKAKGTAFEVAVSAWLVEQGFPYAERRALAGSTDRGDIAGIPGVVLELKAAKQICLSEWMDEVRVEKQNAKAQVGACVVKRRSHSIAKSYVVMELQDFIELIR